MARRLRGERSDHLQSAGQFGGDGHDFDPARRRVEQLGAFVEVRIADATFRLRAFKLGVDVRAFDVEAENLSRERSSSSAAIESSTARISSSWRAATVVTRYPVVPNFNNAREIRRIPSSPSVITSSPPLPWKCVSMRAGHDDAPPGVDDPRAGLRLDRARRADGFDVTVFAERDAVFDHFIPCDDTAANDC